MNAPRLPVHLSLGRDALQNSPILINNNKIIIILHATSMPFLEKCRRLKVYKALLYSYLLINNINIDL